MDSTLAFNAAINFALDEAEDGMIFLAMWREGDWEGIAKDFPEFDLNTTGQVNEVLCPRNKDANSLEERRVHKSFFAIGVYDPEHHDRWPWHCHYDDGVYLSVAKRLCKMSNAAEFDTIDDARQFYAEWKRKRQFKMEVIEYKRWVNIPADSSIDEGWQAKNASLTIVE